MPGAQIAFDQAANPIPVGTAGIARDDIWQSQTVVCRSVLSGNTTYLWQFLDRPPGSAAVLTNATTANAHFTPDLLGTYRIQLVTNGGGLGNQVVLIIRVRYSSAGGLLLGGVCLPAFGERAGEDNVLIPPVSGPPNARGYAPFFEAMWTLIQTLSGGSPPYSLDCTAGGTIVMPLLSPMPKQINAIGTPSGLFAVTLPMTAGQYTLDLLNATSEELVVNAIALVNPGQVVSFTASPPTSGIPDPTETIGVSGQSDVLVSYGSASGLTRQILSIAGSNQLGPGSQPAVPVYGAGLFQLDAASSGVTPPVAGIPTGWNGSGKYYVAPSFPGLTALTDGGQQVDPSGNVVADCPALGSPNAARNTQALQSAVGKSWVDTLVGPSASNVVAFSIPPGITSARVLLQARVTATDGITETAGDVYAGETLLSWVNGFGGAVSVVPVKAGGDSVLSENALPASGSISGMTLAASTDTFNAWLSYATAGTLDPSTTVDVDVTILFARTC